MKAREVIVHEITLTVSTTPAHASGDVLADTQKFPNAVTANGGACILESVVALDSSDQGENLQLVFMRSNVSLGTENAAVSISDADAEEIIGIVSVAGTDFADLVGSQLATVRNIELPLKAASGTRDLYIGAISRGTGTYATGEIKLKIAVTAE